MTWTVTRGEFTVTCDTAIELEQAVRALSAVLSDEEWATRVETPPAPFGPVSVDVREAPAGLQAAAELDPGFPAMMRRPVRFVPPPGVTLTEDEYLDNGTGYPVGEFLTPEQYDNLVAPIPSEPQR